jgi:hypothetical protein
MTGEYQVHPVALQDPDKIPADLYQLLLGIGIMAAVSVTFLDTAPVSTNRTQPTKTGLVSARRLRLRDGS